MTSSYYYNDIYNYIIIRIERENITPLLNKNKQ